MDRFEQRYVGWKQTFISRGERLTLIRITVINLPIYFFLSLLTISANVAKKMKVIQCRFLWKDEEVRRRYWLVS